MITFKHSGLLGDIIYSLPAMLELASRAGEHQFAIQIPCDKRASHAPGLKHMSGNLMCSQAMFDFIKPLLLAQSYIASVEFLPEKKISSSAMDFDLVRNGLLNVSAGNIKDYYFKLFALMAQKTGPWIQLGAGENAPRHGIIVGRSTRYLNDAIDYMILNKLGMHVGFIGTENEYSALKDRYPGLEIEHLPVRDALEAARLIASSRLYIGNQSFFFALAEALQTDRILEVFEPVPNVVPSGGRYGQFITSQGLAFLLASFLGVSPAALGAVAETPRYVLSR
jgi:hypothetical protein